MAEEQVEEKKSLMMQTVVIQLADGRQGIFAGPELITETEMFLKCIPRIVHVDFLPSREFGKAPEFKKEEVPANVEQKEITDRPIIQIEPESGGATNSMGEKA